MFSFGEDVDLGLIGCNAVWTCKYVSAFQRSINTGVYLRRYNPEDQHRDVEIH
jgi:hypothetical protein